MHPTISFVLLSLLLTVPAAQAAKLYRWVDADGNVHYTDQIPPEQVERARHELSDEGVRTQKVERAKTREEIEEERRLEKLRAEQQRIIEKQQAEDRVLLRTFRSEDDLLMARDGKVTAIDLQIKVIRGNIRRYQERLAQMQRKAANLERAGRPVPKNQVENIETTLRQIKEAYSTIEQKEQDKTRIRQAFATDLKRFRELKNISDPTGGGQDQESGALPNLVSCANPTACAQAWKRAEAFVRQHATTPMQMHSDSIIMTAAPVNDNDVTVTVSRLRNRKTGTTALFMDYFCKDSPGGREHCATASVAAIRQKFHSAVSGTRPQQSDK